MIEVEVVGARSARASISAAEVRGLCEFVATRLSLAGGHLAVSFVDAERMTTLNREHRGLEEPTDVLSFPIDGGEPLSLEATRELGDIVICPEHTADMREAVVHGMLHLMGMDHESDAGEMLRLQDELLARSARSGR